jgi:hypothetical protein
MSEHEAIVAQISQLAGIADHYTDAFGRSVHISEQSRRALLAGFGLDTGTLDAARASLAEIERLRHGLVPALIPVQAGAAIRIATRLTSAEGALWRLTDESGAIQEGRGSVRAGPGGPVLELPPLPAGYHRLRIEANGTTARATIIAAPPRVARRPQALGGHRPGLWPTLPARSRHRRLP